MKKYALAIHGGAGTILPSMMTPALEMAYNEALEKALKAGQVILQNEGSALEAVEAAVKVMEDSPLFNAGRGAVFSNEGTNEMEASIMCGKHRIAGAIAEVKSVKNPISLAKKVLEDDRFVFLNGKGAERYADQFDELKKVSPDYFYTEERYNQWQAVKNEDRALLDHDGASNLQHEDPIIQNQDAKGGDYKFGTVGAVALDMEGNLAAATSTGGLTNKKFGRLGDSALIGCGTYADNHSCAVSCTGYGEHFIQNTVARDISARMEFGGMSLKEAANKVVMDQLVKCNGEGGIIAIDKDGNIELVFNSEGMYRGKVCSDQELPMVAIYR
ncbi:isoaspartyl peptidase/L-asparaginase [Limibacter armeniacum]|uniref:isoaspartyl peptidase/L-asparaginase family protein n=1 Tax=Limibacter armeniacum TaxID=466084 RepID=UPI002FE60D4B